MFVENESWEEFCKRHAPKHPQVYDACMKMAEKNAGSGAIPWIHLADAVNYGSISPLEAYDAISLGYLPEVLMVRKSRYIHLLTAPSSDRAANRRNKKRG